MSIRNTITAGAAALVLAASSTVVMAQATGTNNNSTTMPNSEMKDKTSAQGMEKKQMEKNSAKTSAGTSENQAKDLRGHSETPTTGKKMQ